MRTRVVLLLLAVCFAFLIMCDGELDMERAPSSQPTMIFVAPSVPEDYPSGFGEVPTLSTTSAPKVDSNSEFNKEIVEENRTAINTSAYILYTFVGLIVFMGASYIIKRYGNFCEMLPSTRY